MKLYYPTNHNTDTVCQVILDLSKPDFDIVNIIKKQDYTTLPIVSGSCSDPE